jgi:hypothetical protein
MLMTEHMKSRRTLRFTVSLVSTNDSIQPAQAGDSTQVKTTDRGLGCNRLFVVLYAAASVTGTESTILHFGNRRFNSFLPF